MQLTYQGYGEGLESLCDVIASTFSCRRQKDVLDVLAMAPSLLAPTIMHC
jgi:hypothetical protein